MNHAPFQWMSRAILFAMLTFSISPSALALDLSDIEGHDYEDTITLLTEAGIINGYPDGTYQPDREVNRVEFLKIVVGSVFDDIDTDATDDTCDFSDTIEGEWYIPYLCRAVDEGIVRGYEDGTFKPEQTVNFVEASKIATLAHGQDLSEDGSMWYDEYVTYVSEHLLIPPDIDALDAYLTRGQVAELLGRYYLFDQDGLSAYLADHDFDYMFFDAEGDILVQKDAALVDINDYLDESTWLTYTKLFKNSLAVSEDDWDFTAETGDGTGIFTNWNYLDSDGLTVDIETDEEGTSVNVGNTTDYSLSLTGFIDAIFQDESYVELSDDSDFTGTMTYSDDNMQYDWSEDRVNGDPNFDDSFIWTDSDSDSSYVRSITDGEPTESFILMTPDMDSSGGDQTAFAQGFHYDEGSGGVQSWAWQSSDAEVMVGQTAEDNYYEEFLRFGPTDQALMTLEYDQENVTELFGFSSDDGNYILNMDMTNDDFDETVTYESDEMDINTVLSNMNTLDGTVTLSDDSGESVAMTFVDDVLSQFTATVQDGTDEVNVSYFVEGDSTYIAGLLTTEGISYPLFDGAGMQGYDVAVATDEIFVNSSTVILASNLIDLTFSGDELQIDWGHSGTDEVESGNLSFQGLLTDFNWNLDLGNKAAYDEGLQSASSFQWYKGFELGLDPDRLIQGQQTGGVKGEGIEKDWTLEFDPENAELDQNMNINKDGFEKDFEANISLVDYWLRQQMKLKGEFKGIDVDIDSETTVEDGEVNGTTNVHASTDNVDGEFNVDYGSGENIKIDGSILISPLGSPWRFRTDVSIDGSDVTVKPTFSIPLVDDGNIEINLGLGGEFDTNGKSQGNVNINVHEEAHGIDIGVGLTVGESGELGGQVEIGLGF
ncbi:MAG: S-layer homology domain-containing protein [Candidatus Gracilibacteria bacterium]